MHVRLPSTDGGSLVLPPPPQLPATRTYSKPNYTIKRCNAEHFPPPPSKFEPSPEARSYERSQSEEESSSSEIQLKPASQCLKKRENSVIQEPRKKLTLAPLPEEPEEEIYAHLHETIKDYLRQDLEAAARDAHKKAALAFMLWLKSKKYNPECLKFCTEHAYVMATDFWMEYGHCIHDAVQKSIYETLTKIEEYYGQID